MNHKKNEGNSFRTKSKNVFIKYQIPDGSDIQRQLRNLRHQRRLRDQRTGARRKRRKAPVAAALVAEAKTVAEATTVAEPTTVRVASQIFIHNITIFSVTHDTTTVPRYVYIYYI